MNSAQPSGLHIEALGPTLDHALTTQGPATDTSSCTDPNCTVCGSTR